MDHIEILLLNYFSVIFLTIALSIFISKPENVKESFTMWFFFAQISLSFLMYKVIQIYDGFHIIYIADILFLAVFTLSKITIKSKKKNKIDGLAETIPSLHKLTTEEFSTYLTTLFKAYGFQSVRQVKIQNDDHNNTFDQFLLARHEGILVEIRVINKIKKLTEEHINEVASNFRDSTSQATSWLLATSAKTDENTNIYVRNSGVDIKIFDLTIISNLVYGLAPDYKPSSSSLKNNFILIIDHLLKILTTTRNKLIPIQTPLSDNFEQKSPQKLLNNALGDTKENQPSTIELFEENGVESTTEATVITKTKRKTKNKKKISSTTNQGDLNLPNGEDKIPNTESIKTENELKTESTANFDLNTEQPSILDVSSKLPTELKTDNITNEINHSVNDDHEDAEVLSTQIIEEAFIPDETILIEEEFDPLDNLSSLSETTHIATDVDGMDDFPMENISGTSNTSLINSEDVLFNEFQLVENSSTAIPSIEIIEPKPSFEPSLDLSDIGAAISDLPKNYQNENKE